MKAKFVFENAKENLPTKSELEIIFDEEVNDVEDLIIRDDGTIEYYTWPGSSLRKEIKTLFKNRGWDKYYDIKNIEFHDVDTAHGYIISRFKSEADRITPSFDPDSELPEDEAKNEEFVEDFIEQALDEPEDWLELEFEYVQEAAADGELVFVVEERIDNFFSLYRGEFLDDVYQDRHTYIIQTIANGLNDMFD